MPEGKHQVVAGFLCKRCTSKESVSLFYFFSIKRRKAVLTKRMQYCDLAALSVFSTSASNLLHDPEKGA